MNLTNKHRPHSTPGLAGDSNITDNIPKQWMASQYKRVFVMPEGNLGNQIAEMETVSVKGGRNLTGQILLFHVVVPVCGTNPAGTSQQNQQA